MMDYDEQLKLVQEESAKYSAELPDFVLMLKDVPVFGGASGEVYDEKLLPGCLRREPSAETFAKWMSARYSTFSNVEARMLFTPSFGHSNRAVIDGKTRALSLSDCYWIKNQEDKVLFKEVSPYYNSFWTGSGKYEEGAIPTLYVNGVLSKKWSSAEWLLKFGDNIDLEYECSLLFGEFIKSATVEKKEKCLHIKNFTSTDIMFEPANLSGIFGIDDVFADKELVDRVFGQAGVLMLLLDAVVGNIDRHTGNFGYIRDTNNGDYIGIAPIFDWDRAGTDEEGVLLAQFAEFISGRADYADIVKEVLLEINETSGNDYFRRRAGQLTVLIAGRE